MRPARLLQIQRRANSSQAPEKEVSPHVRGEKLLMKKSDVLRRRYRSDSTRRSRDRLRRSCLWLRLRIRLHTGDG
jgi:hypothetical protein